MKKKILLYVIIVATIFGCSTTSFAFTKKENVSVVPNTETPNNTKMVPAQNITEKSETISLEDAKAKQKDFFEKMEGGLFERITNSVSYLPESIRNLYSIGEISFTTNTKENFVVRGQTIEADGKTIVDIGIVKECKNPEYYTLQAFASFVPYKTDFKPYETEEFLYAWEQEHEADFFDEPISNPRLDYEKYFASICLKDPAYEYNKINAPLTTAYVEDYIEKYSLYCNIAAIKHTCKHESRKNCSLDMRLNWVKATLPEEVRTAICENQLEFRFIDRSQELVDLVGCEFMGLYCPVGSLADTSLGVMTHPTILLVKGYEDYFEDTIRHEIGHFVCDYTAYPVWEELSAYLEKNKEKVKYFSSDDYVHSLTGEYFANAFAYYCCEQCNISEYWNVFSPELNDILEGSIKNLNSTERGEEYERD